MQISDKMTVYYLILLYFLRAFCPRPGYSQIPFLWHRAFRKYIDFIVAIWKIKRDMEDYPRRHDVKKFVIASKHVMTSQRYYTVELKVYHIE